MTEAEVAEYYHEHRDDPRPSARLTPMCLRAARGCPAQLRGESTIREAAQRSGMTVSAFLRQAGLAAASSDVIDLRLRRDVREARSPRRRLAVTGLSPRGL